jgi:hypothetical protein
MNRLFGGALARCTPTPKPDRTAEADLTHALLPPGASRFAES